jgi:transcriptional regulator GlxA family with amidase domain
VLELSRPSDLLRRMRLERAAQLVEAGEGSVSEIAYGVGFKSVAHVSNRFQEHFGVRPSAYRSDRVR